MTTDCWLLLAVAAALYTVGLSLAWREFRRRERLTVVRRRLAQ